MFLSLKDGIFPLSVFQGFGRVDLSRSMRLAGDTSYGQWAEDQRAPLGTGEDADYCVPTTGRGTMKATLVYHDAPGSVGAGVASVNNLDLYMGLSADAAVAGNFVVRRDTLNNVESGLFDVQQPGQMFYVSRTQQLQQRVNALASLLDARPS